MSKTPRTDSMIRAGADDDDFERGINLCRRLETELNEARAEIERLGAVIDTLNIKLEPKGVKEYFEHQTIENFSTKQINQILTDFGNNFERKDKLIEQMREALKGAEQFIENGVDLAYITMPDKNTLDTALDTLPKIKAALEAAERGE